MQREFIKQLVQSLSAEIADSNNQGDRQTALTLQRLANALNRVDERLAAAAEKN